MGDAERAMYEGECAAAGLCAGCALTEEDCLCVEPPPLANEIREECEALARMLLGKNRKYGNSAVEPKRIFSKADPIEQINVRMDDKLSRIASAQGDEDEDPEWDLAGYIILKRIARRQK